MQSALLKVEGVTEVTTTRPDKAVVVGVAEPEALIAGLKESNGGRYTAVVAN